MTRIEYRIQELENGYVVKHLDMPSARWKQSYAKTPTDLALLVEATVVAAEEARDRAPEEESTEQ